METGGTYIVAIGDNTEEITLEEVSGSYGDAQSSMFGGNMHRGGMKPRGGGPGENTSADSTNTAAAAPDMPDMSQDGSTDEGAGQRRSCRLLLPTVPCPL